MQYVYVRVTYGAENIYLFNDYCIWRNGASDNGAPTYTYVSPILLSTQTRIGLLLLV